MRHGLLLVMSTIFKVRGGIPRFNQLLCLALDQLCPVLDLRVHVVSQDDSIDDYRGHGEPWQHARFVPGGGRLGLIGRSIATCARERPDLMLIGLLGMTPLGLPCLPFVRGGYGFVAHGTESWHEKRWSRRFAARRARFAFAVSRDTARALTRSTGLSPGAIRLMPNTLSPDFQTTPAAPSSARGPESLELLTVARLWAEQGMKGVDHTIQAVARLVDRYPDLRYRIVGKGSDKPRLMQLAQSLGLGERVVFEQDLTDEQLVEAYSRCTAYVMPSGQEGFGIVFLEAMRYAKPCIGGNAGGTPEVIEDGRTGFLVPFGDVDRLVTALASLLGDADLRRTLGEAGRVRLLEHFTFDRFRDRLEGYLRELLPQD